MNIKLLAVSLLGLLLLWWLFAPKTPVPSETLVVPLSEDVIPAADEEGTVEVPATNLSDQAVEASEVTPGTIVLSGTFVGLVESEPDGDMRKFLYLLLNDGTEVIRISLRPLLGLTDFNPEERLGVTRGSQVVITGALNPETGDFTIATITSP